MVYTYTPAYYSSLHDTITGLCKTILPFSFKGQVALLAGTVLRQMHLVGGVPLLEASAAAEARRAGGGGRLQRRDHGKLSELRGRGILSPSDRSSYPRLSTTSAAGSASGRCSPRRPSGGSSPTPSSVASPSLEQRRQQTKEPSCGVPGEWVDQRRDAAGEARRLAKGDAEAQEMLAMLGAIPPLVAMLASGDVDLQVEALYALLNLGISNDMNKAAIVAVGAVHKMLKLIDAVGSTPPAVSMAVSANFLSLGALDTNKPIIGASSGAIPFLLETFRNADPSLAQGRQDALRALFNLSIASSNIPRLVSAGLVPNLLSAVGDMEVTERALAVLSNVVSTAEGRRAVRRSPRAFPTLVNALDWSDTPGCQEQAAYVLMVMAHRASADDRAAMLGAGITSSLLELALLGTPLAQRRASRTLERLSWLDQQGKGKQVSEGQAPPASSAPLCEGSVPEDEAGMGAERRAVKQLVQQSLQSNMLRIARRANLPQDPGPPDIIRSLPAAGATSKSLPF